MIRPSALAACLCLAATPGLAQSPPAQSPSAQSPSPQSPPPQSQPAQFPAATPAPPPAVGTEDQAGRQTVKALREGCRDAAKTEGLRGEAKRTAVSACVVKARPELAGRERCRGEGHTKGLRGDGLRAFVKDCLKAGA